jgi:hypothetical protein
MTGGLLMVTLVTVTLGASAAHAAAEASLAGVALLGMVAVLPPPGGPGGPCGPVSPSLPPPQAVTISAAMKIDPQRRIELFTTTPSSSIRMAHRSRGGPASTIGYDQNQNVCDDPSFI